MDLVSFCDRQILMFLSLVQNKTLFFSSTHLFLVTSASFVSVSTHPRYNCPLGLKKLVIAIVKISVRNTDFCDFCEIYTFYRLFIYTLYVSLYILVLSLTCVQREVNHDILLLFVPTSQLYINIDVLMYHKFYSFVNLLTRYLDHYLLLSEAKRLDEHMFTLTLTGLFYLVGVFRFLKERYILNILK